MRRPLFAAGTAALGTLFFCMSLSKTALTVLSGAVFLFAAALILTRKKTLAAYALTFAAVFAVFCCLFEARMLLRVQPSAALAGKTAAVEGVLKAYPKPSENSVCYTLGDCMVNGTKTRLSVRVYGDSLPGASPGDTLRFPAARFFEEERDGFDFHALSSGAWLSAYGKEGAVIKPYAGHAVWASVEKLRHAVNGFFERSLPELHAKIASALFTGESGGLPADFRAKLRVAGASHIFAVSGMHLSVWAGVFFLIFRRRAKTRVWANVFVSGFVLFYMFFTGLPPSVLRAGSMLLVVCCGRMFRLHADDCNTLGAVALALLACNPFLAGNVSFLLSVTATAAIFILYPQFEVYVSEKPGFKKRLLEKGAQLPNGILLSLCVLFFTLPVSSAFFSSVSLLSPLSSLLCTLPAEGVMITAGLSWATSFSAPLSACFSRLCGFCCEAVVRLINALSAFDFAVCPVRETTVSFWFTGTACVCCAVYFLSRKNARAAVSVLLASATLVFACGGAQTLLRRDQTALLLPGDGSATSAALVFGGGAALIGADATYDAAAAGVRFLTENGVRSVKTLIVPTPEDAAGQLSYYAKNFRLKNVFTAEEKRKYFPDAQNYRCAQAFSVSFQNGVTYENFRTAAYAAGRVRAGEKSVLFSFSPENDFSDAPETLVNADILVCRACVPKGLELSAFEAVYVQTDKTAEALRLPAGVCSVGEANGVRIPLE